MMLYIKLDIIDKFSIIQKFWLPDVGLILIMPDNQGSTIFKFLIILNLQLSIRALEIIQEIIHINYINIIYRYNTEIKFPKGYI